MKILVFSWKDIKNPAAGGAEVMTWEILKHLVVLGHEVVLFSSRYDEKFDARETLNGVEIYRAGGRYGVYFWALIYYLKYFRGRFDLVVDEVNTVPFFTPLFAREQKVAFFPQLARKIWFYETRFPISLLGYLLEPLFLLWYRKAPVITISKSSQSDLARFGVKKVFVTRVVSNIVPLPVLEPKPGGLNLLFVGRLVPGKRPLDALKTLEIVRRQVSSATLTLVGNGAESYVRNVRQFIQNNNLGKSVFLRQNMSNTERNELYKRSFLLLVPSVKEGWGLVVTESNSKGTPAVVYNVDGLRDSVLDGQTGLVCQNNSPKELAELCLKVYNDSEFYERLRVKAWENSKNYVSEKTVSEFIDMLLSF
ncbi:MAG: glycosyltransferase family 4 protein [Patescibacteria group bacterium]|nr:glycosyltransferase family 4 protein [Patescibacteria group bacterium]